MNGDNIYLFLRVRTRIVESARTMVYCACAREHTPQFYAFRSLLPCYRARFVVVIYCFYY